MNARERVGIDPRRSDFPTKAIKTWRLTSAMSTPPDEPPHQGSNHNEEIMTKEEKIAAAKALRRSGLSFRKIGVALGITGASAHNLVRGRKPSQPGRRKPIAATAHNVIRRVPVLGAQGSMSCYDAFVSLPRVSILEATHAA